MSAGLQIWDVSGRLVLDATHRLGRIKGIQPVSGPGGVPVDFSDGTPFWSFQPDQQFFHISNETASPIFTVTATSLTWTYSSTAGLNSARLITGNVIYGVY
jgi:hypothetical protein